MKRRRNPSTGRIASFLALFFLLSLVFLIVYTFVVSKESVLHSFNFRVSHAFVKGLALFIHYLIPIQAAGIMLACSLVFKPDTVRDNGAKIPFHNLVSGTVFLLIVLTCAFILLENGLLPLLRKKTQDKEYISRRAEYYLTQAEELEEKGDIAKAIEAYTNYLAINSKNKEIEEQRKELGELLGKPSESRSASSEEIKEAPVVVKKTGYNPRILVQKAKESMEKEDYFSAHYFAGLALRLESENKKAKFLQAEAQKMLNSYPTRKSDDKAAVLFKTKLKGLSALEAEDYISAYYIFRELNLDFPEDAEVPGFLADSLKGLKEISFFKDEVDFKNEAENSPPLPGILNIIFINSDENGEREIIHIDKLVKKGKDIYFYGIEVFKFAGKLEYHLSAPYGKLIDNHINMKCLDREGQIIQPLYKSGASGDMGAIIPLSVPAGYLPAFSLEEGRLDSLGLYELFELRKLYDPAGFDAIEVELRLLIRVARPFLYLIMAVLAVAMGWSYRTRYLGRPPLVTYILVPVLPFATVILADFILQAHKILLNFFLLSLSFTYAVIFLLLIELLFLVFSLLLLSGQMSD
jgi:tetratricopeptide (TPR) repeat protein